MTGQVTSWRSTGGLADPFPSIPELQGVIQPIASSRVGSVVGQGRFSLDLQPALGGRDSVELPRSSARETLALPGLALGERDSVELRGHLARETLALPGMLLGEGDPVELPRPSAHATLAPPGVNFGRARLCRAAEWVRRLDGVSPPGENETALRGGQRTWRTASIAFEKERPALALDLEHQSGSRPAGRSRVTRLR